MPDPGAEAAAIGFCVRPFLWDAARFSTAEADSATREPGSRLLPCNPAAPRRPRLSDPYPVEAAAAPRLGLAGRLLLAMPRLWAALGSLRLLHPSAQDPPLGTEPEGRRSRSPPSVCESQVRL